MVDKLAQRSNSYWMDQAEVEGLELWERQPQETDVEWAAWNAYRAYYPGKQRTQTAIAAEVGISVATLKRYSNLWDYGIRMRAWATHIDSKIRNTRYNDIMEMNEKHISMAKKLNEKLERAIDFVDPEAMTPHQIVQMAKLATEMEKKARADKVVVGEQISENAGVVEHKAAQRPKMKQNEMQEVLGILLEAGALKLQKPEEGIIDAEFTELDSGTD